MSDEKENPEFQPTQLEVTVGNDASNFAIGNHNRITVKNKYGKNKDKHKPELKLYMQMIRDGINGIPPTSFDACLILGIENIGATPARFPAIGIIEDKGFKLSRYGVDGNGNTGLPEETRIDPDSQLRSFAGEAQQVILPGRHLKVTRVEYKCPYDSFQIRKAYPAEIKVKYELHCIGFNYKGETTFPLRDELLKIYEGWTSR